MHAASPFLLGAQAIAAAGRAGIPSVAIFQTDVAGYARRNHLGAATKFAWRVVQWIHEGADLTLVPSSASMHDLELAGVERLARWGRGVDLATYHPQQPARADRAAAAPAARPARRDDRRLRRPHRAREAGRAARGAARHARASGSRSSATGRRCPLAKRATARACPSTWLGSLTGAELAAAYASFDVFVHTGTEETFGQTVQEAHASRTAGDRAARGRPDRPRRATASTGTSSTRRTTATSGSPSSSCVADPDLRASMGEAGRRKVLGRSWAAVGRRAARALRATSSRRAPPRTCCSRARAALLERVPRFELSVTSA